MVAMIGSSFRCAVSYERPTDVTNAIDVNRFTCKKKRKKLFQIKAMASILPQYSFQCTLPLLGLSEYYIGKKEEVNMGERKRV